MEGVHTWSVGTDGGVVTATCPEPLRSPSGPMPEWMSRAAGAIRDALRALPIADGTVLEAALAGTGDLGEALLANVGIPESQVHAGVRLRRMPARAGGVVQTYRRAPAASTADDGDADVLAAVEVPIAGVFELDSARRVWLATRRVVVATLPPGASLLRAGSPSVQVSPRARIASTATCHSSPGSSPASWRRSGSTPGTTSTTPHGGSRPSSGETRPR